MPKPAAGRTVRLAVVLALLSGLFATLPSTGHAASSPLFRAHGTPGQVRGEPDEAPEPGPIHRTSDTPPWPKDFEVGLQASRAFAYQFGLVETDSLLKRVSRIGYLVASQAGKPDILFNFHILDLPDPNALALPGGFVFITKGMMDLKLSDSVMAELLGHEIAHVTQGHFSRADRLSTALSLLQTAVTVAALVAVPPSTSGGYDRDPDTGQYRLSLAGQEAAVQGSSLFGSVFRELLLRGYSRGLEMEADEVGRHLAAHVGIPSSASVELMEELHARIYEDQEYGYWRTHPYFTDRVARARAAVEPGGTPPDTSEVRDYREGIAGRLSALANTIEDGPTSLFLYRAALEASPDGHSSFEVAHRLLQVRSDRLNQEKPVLRAYGSLIADYDSLLQRADAPGSGLKAEWLSDLRRERDELNRNRGKVHDEMLKLLDRPGTGTPILEVFLDDFPKDPRAPDVRLRLADLYRLSDRADQAALVLAEIGRTEKPDGPAREMLRTILPKTKELTTNQKILMETPSDSVRAWASARLRAQAASLDSLETGSRFLQEYPVSLVSTEVRGKVETLAMNRYYKARLKESLRDLQAALDGYNEVILLAPKTRAADLAREGISRIQTLAAEQ